MKTFLKWLHEQNLQTQPNAQSQDDKEIATQIGSIAANSLKAGKDPTKAVQNSLAQTTAQAAQTGDPTKIAAAVRTNKELTTPNNDVQTMKKKMKKKMKK